MTFQTAPPLSHRGGRTTNQDSVGWREADGGTCWVLADGLGGHASGEVASEAAVEGALTAFEHSPGTDAASIQRCIDRAQSVVRTLQAGSPALDTMRTTLVVVAARGGEVRWGHVGDSRLYVFRDCKISHRTTDHSVPQALVEAGEIEPEEVRGHPDRNRLLRAVGGNSPPKPAISEASGVTTGDAFLLCSDGFWELVEEDEMETDLAAATSPEAWISTMEARLTARASGSHDNYSALAAWAT